MKTLALAACTAVALLSSACIVHDNDHHHDGNNWPPPPTRFDLTFAISLDGATCAAVPEVDRIWLRLEGPAVADETVLCPPEGGRTFDDIPKGTYVWRIDGLGLDDTVLYSATGIVDLNQDLVVRADLVPIGGSTIGDVTFFWSFGGQDCATAGVSEVRVTIPGQFDDNVPCATEGVEGITIVGVAAGETTWSLSGLAADLTTELYAGSGTVTVPAGGEADVTIDLSVPVG